MSARHRWLAVLLLGIAVVVGGPSRGHTQDAARRTGPVPAASRQLVLVVTPAWDSTSGELRRFARTGAGAPWRPVGAPVPIVVGRSGLAWGADSLGSPGDPHKREGDGRSPAGVFPLDTAFGFAPAPAMSWVRLPYMPLTAGTECVDDTASVHYNSVVDRAQVARVDWSSAERMREIGAYRVGVIVGYNATPRRVGRGSCIFLHIWGGPGSSTAGCTAFPQADVEALLGWLDPARKPVIVQLPAAQYQRLRGRWRLP